MFKREATDLDTQSTTTQQRLTCALKNARFLPDGCCGLDDKRNKIMFRTNISPPLNNDRWVGRGGPMAWPSRSADLTPMDYFLWSHINP